MENIKPNRYPGINFFTKKDSNIFCGRKEDTEKFYTQVMLSKTLVLHADSGAGKSSMIQAGFLPMLEENQKKLTENQSQFFPITIRFDFLKKPTLDQNYTASSNPHNSLIDGIISRIKIEIPALLQNEIPYEKKGHNETLWIVAKKMAKQNMKLLLILDQFEELQNYDNQTATWFKKGIAELLSTDIPKAIYDNMKEMTASLISDENIDAQKREEFNQNMQFLEKPLDAKIIFVVREDRLGIVSSLSDYLPDILKNDFMLKSLTPNNASIAFTQPAMANGDFATPKFIFESDDLVLGLVNEIADQQTKLVDPIQVQIVATTIEKNILKKFEESDFDTSKEYVVTQEDIPPMVDIIKVFYEKCWGTIKEKQIVSDAEFEVVKNRIISVLVVNERRDLVNLGWLITRETRETDEQIVKELLQTGLIREVPFGPNNKFYQLCHDRFIKPVSEDLLKIEEKKATEDLEQKLKDQKDRADKFKVLNVKIKWWNRVAFSAAFICLLLVLVAYNYWDTANKERIRAKQAEEEAVKQEQKATNETIKSNKALISLANMYIGICDETIENGKSSTDLYAAKFYLDKAKEILKDNKNELLYQKIETKIDSLNNIIEKQN